MKNGLTAGDPYEPGMPKMQLVQAYFVFQKYDGLFPPDQALCEGTIFPEFRGRKNYDPLEERTEGNE